MTSRQFLSTLGAGVFALAASLVPALASTSSPTAQPATCCAAGPCCDQCGCCAGDESTCDTCCCLNGTCDAGCCGGNAQK